MRLRIDADRPLSPSGQLVEAVLDALASGDLDGGARLPSVREAAAQALVNPNTVARAWRDLEALGVVEGRAGAGVFVTAGGPEVARRERRRATLEALRRAAEQAVRSGHETETVVEETRRAAARAEVEGRGRGSEARGGRR